jgi:hypothetical protein
LQFAHWNITATVPNPEFYAGFFDGVGIWYEAPRFPLRFPLSPEEKSKIGATERCQDAARALEAYLLSKNWKARARPFTKNAAIGQRIPDVEHEIPSDTLTIVVGFKPNSFFDPDWVKQGEERYKHFLLEERHCEKNLPNASPPPFPK